MTAHAWRHVCGALNDLTTPAAPGDLPRICMACFADVDRPEDVEAVYELVPVERTVVRCDRCSARLVGVVCADCGTPAVRSNGYG